MDWIYYWFPAKKNKSIQLEITFFQANKKQKKGYQNQLSLPDDCVYEFTLRLNTDWPSKNPSNMSPLIVGPTPAGVPVYIKSPG